MAITLQAQYSKKLGLPGFSSHQYSVTLTSELTDLNQVPQESARLHALMQSCVDREIQQTGFLPTGGIPIPIHKNGNGTNGNGNGHNGHDHWACSDKQKALVLKIVEENHLEKADVESLAQDRFSKGVRQLNKLEASGLIEALLEMTGQKNRRGKPLAAGGGR
jgi:hypothetical protein